MCSLRMGMVQMMAALSVGLHQIYKLDFWGQHQGTCLRILLLVLFAIKQLVITWLGTEH